MHLTEDNIGGNYLSIYISEAILSHDTLSITLSIDTFECTLLPGNN